MDSTQEFRLKLTEVASELDIERLARLKFLCSDLIPGGDLEKIKTPEHLFLELEQRKVIEPHRLKFLADRLDTIGRKDLADDLRNNEREKIRGKADSGHGSSTHLDSISEWESYNNRGKVEFREGRYKTACQQFTSALACLPKEDQHNDCRVKYLNNRASCYVKLRKFKEAHKDCDQALLLNPHNSRARLRLAESLQGEGKIAQAFTEARSLLQKYPQNAREKALEKMHQGEADFREANYDAAIRDFSEGILLLPQLEMYADEMKKSYKQRADSFLGKGNLEAAWNDCEEAERWLADDDVLYTKMKVLYEMGRFKECYSVCQRLLETKFKVEAEETIGLLLPKIMSGENLKCKTTGTHGESVKKSRKRTRKGSKKKKGDVNETQTSPRADASLNFVPSNTAPSLPDDLQKEVTSADDVFSEAELDPGSSTFSGSTQKGDAQLSTTVNNVGLQGSKSFVKREEDTELTEKVDVVSKAKDEEASDKKYYPGLSTEENNGLKGSSLGEAYPHRILLICDRWSCWHRIECVVNKELCRSFVKSEDTALACLVLDATEQEITAATKDGVYLIRASLQPGIPSGDKQLLNLHTNFPFKVDLVVGHGRISGTAAAIQEKRLGCKRLHIYHTLPQEDEDAEEKERSLGLSADFVAGIGPLVVEQWKAILNREVFTIIPGLPDIAPRNQIMTWQSRCLILGNMNDPIASGLESVTAALKDSTQQRRSIHLTVMGSDNKKVQSLKKAKGNQRGSSQMGICFKPLDVSEETVGVVVRGSSLVLIPSFSDGFGVVALVAIAAKVPILIPAASGLAKFLYNAFGNNFLKFMCSAGDDSDAADAWTSSIDDLLDDRKEAFSLAAFLFTEWSAMFSWHSCANNLLKYLGKSGLFTVTLPLTTENITLPSACSSTALKFIEELDLPNKRCQHVLFLSPEDSQESPFIRHFAQVPWAAVLDFDVNSTKTGFLASCDPFCESRGMKICRILPPSDEDRKKASVVLLTGIPWVLLEGIPDSKRSIKENYDWMRELFLALGKTHQVPITFLVLWKTLKETESLCKILSRILTVVKVSPLYSQVKLVIASTGDNVSSHLEDIAEDWGVKVQNIGLEDMCNALFQSIGSSPIVQENQDFALPVADPDQPQKVSFKVLPSTSRWINAEMEILFQSVGDTPQFGTDDALHFYRGGLISWYAIQMGYAVERSNWKDLKGRVDEQLVRAGTVRLAMPHIRGAGGSTSARKILFDYREKYPCVCLKSVGHAEVHQGIKVLADFCKLPVVILVDCKQLQSDEFDVDTLYNVLSNDRIPCVILEVIHQYQKQEKFPPQVTSRFDKPTPARLADDLDYEEAKQFVAVYGTQRKEKLSKLRSLLHDSKELQIPFYYALTTFEDSFTGLEPFVHDCLKGLEWKEREILLFLAMAYHYGHDSLLANEFAGLLQAPKRNLSSLESVLPYLSRQLLIEEDGKWRPRHDLIAVEMLRQLLTKWSPLRTAQVHRENWRNQLPEKALDFFDQMSEAVINAMLLSRIPNDSYFSQLICDIPFVEDAIKLFEKATSRFPDNPFFKVHFGRFYSIQKKSAGFPLAIKYTDEGISCSDSYPRVVRGQFFQMKGVVYSREINYLMEQNAEIDCVSDMAQEAVKNFRRAVSVAPDFVDGYIPEVRMMCRVFEYVDRKTGNFSAYVKSADAIQFIIEAISDTSRTLECVPDNDAYSYWRMRLACIGRQQFTKEQAKRTLDLLEFLRKSGRGSISSINCQIVIMRMQLCDSQSYSGIASELIDLLNEALKHDPNTENTLEQTMRLWVRLAPFILVPLSESETKVFHWCSKTKSVRSYLFKYIIAYLHLLEGKISTYGEIMRNAKEDLYSEIKAISRDDVGRCRHPDKPVVWLRRNGKGMGHLVYLDDNISEILDVRMKRSINNKYTKELRPLTGLIVKTGPKTGIIRVNDELDVSFRADLCEPTPLVSSSFMNKKVTFFLAFNFFGSDAYNVRLVAE
ncbi:uncharacterized protein [Montipora capricornis]|uniref:uncharacterized protein isoform X2 n=1 Tax=Montipora capricornis TaxID=246305 RepID=UPI0035F179CC